MMSSLLSSTSKSFHIDQWQRSHSICTPINAWDLLKFWSDSQYFSMDFQLDQLDKSDSEMYGSCVPTWPFINSFLTVYVDPGLTHRQNNGWTILILCTLHIFKVHATSILLWISFVDHVSGSTVWCLGSGFPWLRISTTVYLYHNDHLYLPSSVYLSLW
jgi:hypothetical protein